MQRLESAAVAVILAAVLGTTACGAEGSPSTGDGSGSVAATSANAATGPADDSAERNWWRSERTLPSTYDNPQTTSISVDWLSVSADPLLRAAHVVVEGDITAIDGPYWNSASGQAEVPNSVASTQRRRLYREVTISVTRVLYDELGLPADTVKVIVGGGGDPDLIPDDVGARISVGDRAVFIIRWDDVLFAEGFASALVAFYREYGVLAAISPGVYAQPQAGAAAYVFGPNDLVLGRFPDGIPVEQMAALIEQLKSVPTERVPRGVEAWASGRATVPFPTDGAFADSPSG